MNGRLRFTIPVRNLADLEEQISERIIAFLGGVSREKAEHVSWDVTPLEVVHGDGTPRILQYEADVEVVLPS